MEPRLKAELWVRAALRLGQVDGRFAAVLRRGDADAGGILVVLRTPKGLAVLSQARAADGTVAWLRGTGPDAVDQATADVYVDRQLRSDPDLWVVEFETPDMVPPFAGRML